MVFSSISFLVYFLPIVVGIYYFVPMGLKNIVLLISSLFFYAWGEPVYILLMIFSILFNYAFGLMLSKVSESTEKRVKAKWLLSFSILGNLGILGFYKYGDFLVENINGLMGTSFSLWQLPLPIGISFYTFQAMSYIIDLYRGKVNVQKNIVAFGTYVALFPQLIAGPIVRFETIENQLFQRHSDMKSFAEGVKRFIIGLSKKVLLANNMGILWENIFALEPSQWNVAGVWLGAIAFTMQIYFDFSGYSDMAIGLGKMFGFHFPENFNYPYTATSITEFWRRWHISLSSWFREYVYIPLGGNRQGVKKQLRNILIVWVLTGLWHGASWNFVIWGIYFAILLVMEKLFLSHFLDKLKSQGVAGRAVCHAYTMFLVIISWVIFAVGDQSVLSAFLNNMFDLTGGTFINTDTLYMVKSNLIILLICILGVTKSPLKLWNAICVVLLKKNCLARLLVENIGLLILLLLSFAYIVSSTYNPFLYFRF